MAPSKKSILEGFSSFASKIKGYSQKAKKAIEIGKRAKDVYKTVKSAAGESACANKKCSKSEKLMDFAERAVRGGKALYGQKETVRDIYESGRQLVSGRMSSKKQSSEQMSAKPSNGKEKSMVSSRSSKPSIPSKPKFNYSKPSSTPPMVPSRSSKPSIPSSSKPKPSMVPKAPAAPKPSMAKAPSSNAALMEQIRAGKTLKKTTVNAKPSSGGGMEEMLKREMAKRYAQMNR
jgi:hypothetical protein